MTITQHWFRWRLGAKQATSLYLNQCWPDSLMNICGSRWRWVKEKKKTLSIFCHFSPLWCTCGWSLFSWKTRTYLSETFNAMPADKLVAQGARVLATMVLTKAIIGSDNGLSPNRRQAIIWTNAGIVLIRPLGTNFSPILIEIHTFSFKKRGI